MNIRKIYTALIENAKNRGAGDESHHIVPRSIGGTNDASNLVLLTFREHCIAHRLLSRIHPYSPALSFASYMMYARGGSRLYGESRRAFVDAAGVLISDGWARKRGFDGYNDQCIKVLNDYMEGASTSDIPKKYGISESCTLKSARYGAHQMGLLDKFDGEMRRRRREIGKKVRAGFTDEQEARRISAVVAVDRTEYAERLKVERRGAGNPMYGKRRISKIVQCPHCLRSGAESQMKRWHMSNCKEKT